MPHNYNASLRLAQLLLWAGRNAEAVAACERARARAPGPLGRAWTGTTEAQALLATGDKAGARRVLAWARRAANEIPHARNRESNLRSIAALEAQAAAKP